MEKTLSSPNKMGTAPVLKLLVGMSWPPMVSMMIQALYNIVDSIFVSQINQDALTAVSLAYPLQFFALSIAVGTSIGANSLISRRLGQKLPEEASSAAEHGMFLCFISYIIIMLLALLFVPSFIGAFTESDVIFKYGCDYSYIVLCFSFGLFMSIACEKVFQSTGNMIIPMLMQALGAVINIGLDPILIFTFGLEVAGAAIATVISQIIVMIVCFSLVFGKRRPLKISFRKFKPSLRTIKDIYVVGIPMMLMQALISVLTIFLNALLITFSEMAVALFGVYVKLQSFIYMPTNGLTQGLLPILGYNYGARNKERMMKALRYALIIAACLMLLGTALFWLIPKPLLLMFNASADMLIEGEVAMRCISSGFILAGISFATTTVFSAIGKGIFNLLLSLCRQIVFLLPLAYIFSASMGLFGVWLAFPTAEVISIFILIIVYRYVKKKYLNDSYFSAERK